MSPLRQRFLDDLRLAGYSERTIESYSSPVALLARYYQRSPDQITPEELRQFFVYLKTERHLSDSSFKLYATGLKFFYEKTLGEDWPLFDLVRPGKSRKLAVCLSHEEVKKLLSLVRSDDCQMALTTIYACGLRLGEGLNLRLRHLDGTRGLLRVEGGKGNKDRYVPIPARLLQLLRAYWTRQRPQDYLFPSQGKAEAPMHETRLQKVFKAVVRESGITQQQASIHTLRHSYATRLLEQGVNLKQLQEL